MGILDLSLECRIHPPYDQGYLEASGSGIKVRRSTTAREAEELQPDRFNPGRSCPQVIIEVLIEREGGELLYIISLYMSFWYDFSRATYISGALSCMYAPHFQFGFLNLSGLCKLVAHLLPLNMYPSHPPSQPFPTLPIFVSIFLLIMPTLAFTSSHANKNYNYDAFLNHRGPDVKKTIASSLYRWLTSHGLQVFLDYQELEVGQNLNTQIKEAIASASLHVAIFSPGYAESTWCLEELHLMFESGKPIIPIFYKVKPADLRWAQDHRGAYAAALDKHENRIAWNGQPRHNSTTVGKWRNALSRAADISGFDLDAFNGDEGELLDKVVKCVLKSVKSPNLVDVGKHTFGLDEKAQDFDRKVLSQQHGGRVQVVGIAGPQGVGKTILAKELFNRKSSNYKNSYFLFDVRENSKCSSLPSLQKKIVKGLTQLDQDVDNVDEGKWMLQKHLSKSRVLLVLDDVDDADHVDALLPVDVLHPESLILITSRNRNVLKWSGIQEPSIYHLSGLDQHHSTQLFCFYAFGQPHPKSGFEYLVHQFLKDCNGVPLCLKECGRLVANNNNKSDWEDQLKKRLQTLHTDIPRSLQISSEIQNRSGSILDSVTTIGMHDHLRTLSINLPWGGTEEINDLSHNMTVISHSSEEFNDLSHDGN